jgi:hypothetical protein
VPGDFVVIDQHIDRTKNRCRQRRHRDHQLLLPVAQDAQGPHDDARGGQAGAQERGNRPAREKRPAGTRPPTPPTSDA